MPNYSDVNVVWPEHAPIPNGQEALAGARKLVRLALALGPPLAPTFKTKMPKAFRLTSGNRYSWTQRGVFMVNPDHRSFSFAGWGAMVHDIAHWAARRLYGEAHGSKECFIEYTLAKHVVSSGWLEGKLRRPEKEAPSKRDLQEARRQRVLANLQRWEAKRRRAERAIKKLRQKAKYYEKALAA